MDNEPQQTPPETAPQQPVEPQWAPQPVQQPVATEEPLFTPPTPTPVEPPKPKKSHKGLVYAIVALLLIGGGLAGGWLLYGRDVGTSSQQAQTSTAKTTTTQTVDTLQPEDVTNKIKTTLATQYTLIESSTETKLQSGQVSVNAQTSSPAYKTPGYTFYNTYNGGSTLYLMSYYITGGTLPTAVETTIRTEVAKIYTDYGLTKTATHGNTSDSTLVNVYTGKGLVCTIDDPSNAGSPTTASCGLISAYKDAAAKVKPFADVLTDLTATTVLGSPNVKNSTVDGYQTATIGSGNVEGMGGHADLFYRKTSGPWKYLTGTQSELPCSMFNTTDLKNAYMGQSCYDTVTSKDSTVQ